MTTLGATIAYAVWHDASYDANRCVGGLKGKLSAGNVVMFESPVVPLGEDYEENRERGEIGKGARVLAEAWCYGVKGEELGYIAAEGVVVPSHSVGVSYTEPYETAYCLTGQTSGSVIPCIVSGIIEQ